MEVASDHMRISLCASSGRVCAWALQLREWYACVPTGHANGAVHAHLPTMCAHNHPLSRQFPKPKRLGNYVLNIPFLPEILIQIFAI